MDALCAEREKRRDNSERDRRTREDEGGQAGKQKGSATATAT